jgi:tRNA (guanine26-N2/guanine27-N2)-dimethyltransferase
MKLVEHAEGRSRLVVPARSLTEDPPPTSPVFFNPAASLNRDVTVAVTAAAGGSTFCDSMAGVGARGVRVANEVDRLERVAMVDFNEEALKLARRSAVLNGVTRKCEFSTSETSSFLFSRSGREERFDFVDVDPFGTPVRQLQGAISATSSGGVLSVTATDTAVLCGVYSEVARRRYGASSVNNSFNHESAVRILLGSLAQTAAQVDVGVEPVLEHSTRHYIRVFARIQVGATKAEKALRGLGFVVWCPACGHVESADQGLLLCARCGKKAKAAGPLWAGPLTDPKLVDSAGRRARSLGFGQAARAVASLEGVDGFPPWSFSVEGICSSLRVATVPEDRVYRHLLDAGHRAMRTPFEKTGVKTDATFDEVKAAVADRS